MALVTLLIPYHPSWSNPSLTPTSPSTVTDFSMELLKVDTAAETGFCVVERIFLSSYAAHGLISHTKTGVCLMDDNEMILLVQEDKRHLELGDRGPNLWLAIVVVQTRDCFEFVPS
jgi:hypothetical protein